MSGFSTVALVAILSVFFLVVMALMLWQEAKARLQPEERTYVISAAVTYIYSRLNSELKSRLQRTDVQRILEWELHYLQGLAQKKQGAGVEIIAGGDKDATEYIVHQISETHRINYSKEDITAILEIEAQYLVSIGAVGDPVNDRDADNPTPVSNPSVATETDRGALTDQTP